MSADKLIPRLALFAEFANRARLGRTAIMKLCFFLQESQGVDLGYQFSLYSYGPFDSDVLADLSTAVHMNILKSTTVYYPSGTGFEYSPGADSSIKDIAALFLKQNKGKLDWVLTNFGKKKAGELELLSTTLFVAKFGSPKSEEDLFNKVAVIKPHFNRDQIKSGFHELVALNVLRSAAAPSGTN